MHLLIPELNLKNNRPMNSYYFSRIVFFYLMICLVACQKTSSEGTEAAIDYKRTDNSVVMRLLGDADLLNPQLTTNNSSILAINQVYQYLLAIDPISLELIPQLAKSRPGIKNIENGPYKGGVKFTFEIHDEAVWDDGKAITAEDYIFSAKVMSIPGLADPNLQASMTYFKQVEIDPDNPKKFDVIFNKKYILAEAVAGNHLHVLPKHIYDEEGLLDDIPLVDLTDLDKATDLASSSDNIKQFMEVFASPEFTREKIIGSGPYSFTSWTPGQEIVLDRKEDWWADDLQEDYLGLQAFPDQIIFKPIPENATAITGIKGEELDVVIRIQPDDFVSIQNQDIVTSKYNLHAPENLAFYFLYLNTGKPNLSDKRVRKALAHAVNVDTLINRMFMGLAKKIASPVAYSTPDYHKELQPLPYDPEKAKALLKEAGWEDSNNNGIVDKMLNGELTELSLEYHHINRASSEANAIVVKDFASEIGIDIQLTPVSHSTGIQLLNNKDYDIYSGGLGQLPIWLPRQNWHSEGRDRTSFGSTYTDELIERSELAEDPEERKKIYQELQQIIYDEQPVIFLFSPQNPIAIHKRFETPLSSYYPGVFPNLLKIKNK